MTEQQIYFFRGCCVTILMFAIISLSASILLTPDEPEDNSRFEVLDQYQGCSVIRYTDPTSRWHYFLKCP